MKILVTGTKGYIATSFAACMKNARTICLRDNSWRDISFAGYDAVLHTAGIAHVKENRRNQFDYYTINRDLTVELAKKAKKENVRQFVFLSTISVYGKVSGTITQNTPTVPTTNYGRSKLAAESLLTSLAGDTFKIAILRPPMVYGSGCPGNYSRLCRLVKMAPFFPDYQNARSLISIENLCVFIQDIIENEREGLFFPRDPAPVSTTKLAREIAKAQGKNLRLTKAFNPLISLLMPIGVVSKLFGDLMIDMDF